MKRPRNDIGDVDESSDLQHSNGGTRAISSSTVLLVYRDIQSIARSKNDSLRDISTWLKDHDTSQIAAADVCYPAEQWLDRALSDVPADRVHSTYELCKLIVAFALLRTDRELLPSVNVDQVWRTVFAVNNQLGSPALLDLVSDERYPKLPISAVATAPLLADIAHALEIYDIEAEVPDTTIDKVVLLQTYYLYFTGTSPDCSEHAVTDCAFPVIDGQTPIHTFARYPTRQHRIYISNLVEKGADFDLVDAHGCKALDYCVYNEDQETEALVLQGLRWKLDSQRLQRKLYQAKIRKTYRELLESRLRPLLQDPRSEAFTQMRTTYACALAEDEVVSESFDQLRFLYYNDFKENHRLPRYSDGKVRAIDAVGYDLGSPTHIVYLAYRWLYKNPITGKTANDDGDHTQYRRMLAAIERFLDLRPDVDANRLGIWMDSACVDRKRPLPGIAALPLCLAQCDTLITIEDEHFWERAWCSVEAYVFQKLRKAFHRHTWLRYVREPEQEQEPEGHAEDVWHLIESPEEHKIDMSSKTMTWEEDRDIILFLERQADAF